MAVKALSRRPPSRNVSMERLSGGASPVSHSSPVCTPPGSPRHSAMLPKLTLDSPFEPAVPSFTFGSAGQTSSMPRRLIISHAQQGMGGLGSPNTPRAGPATSWLKQSADDGPSLLLRNLSLGLAAGCMAETMHVLSAIGALTGGPEGVMVLPAIAAMQEALEPLYLVDHAVAIGVWAALCQFASKSGSAKLQEPVPGSESMTLQRLLPSVPNSLANIKRDLFKWLYPAASQPATSPTSPTAAAAAANANAFTTGDFARELERRQRASGSDSGGTVTIERPRTEEPAVPQQAEPASTPAPKTAKRACATKRTPLQTPPGPVEETQAPKETRREKELRERKAYLKNFWYAAGISSAIKDDKPTEVKILGRTVVLFRDEHGKVRCMENLCSHRGAPLGQGTIKKVDGHNCVVCPYHAWGFDGNGVLKDVPTSIKGQLPKRPMLDTYPVEEKGGFIWIFFGSSNLPADERPPIPWIPELEDPKWQAVYGEMEFEGPHWSVFDNALDMAHIHYVHSGSFGNPNKPEILDMNIQQNTFGIQGSFKIHNKPVNKMWEWTSVPHVPVELKAFLPMTGAVRISLGHGIQMITFVNTVPIDEHRSINRFCLIRNFATNPLLDGFVKAEMMKILTEDKVMVETVRPDDMPQEYSLEADVPQIAFRRLRQQFINMGYGVDPSKTLGPHGSLDM